MPNTFSAKPKHLQRLRYLGATFPSPITPMNMAVREYRGVRTSRYTYVRDLKGPWLLYDNEEDPYQLENLCNRPEMRAVQTHLDDVLSDLLEEQNDEFATGHELLDRWGYEMVNPHAFRRREV